MLQSHQLRSKCSFDNVSLKCKPLFVHTEQQISFERSGFSSWQPFSVFFRLVTNCFLKRESFKKKKVMKQFVCKTTKSLEFMTSFDIPDFGKHCSWFTLNFRAKIVSSVFEFTKEKFKLFFKFQFLNQIFTILLI